MIQHGPVPVGTQLTFKLVYCVCSSIYVYVGYPHVHVKMKVMPSRIINVAAFLYNFKSNFGTAPSGGSTVQFNLGY